MAKAIPLKFGTANDQGAQNVHFGIHRGFFADEGIDLSIHRVYGGPELAREFAAGNVHIGEFGSPPALTAIAGGCDIKIIASGTRKKFMMTLAVRSDITDFSQLEGARVGLLSPGSCTEWLAREMWLKNGLDPDEDLEFVILREDHSNILGLFREGKYEAFMATVPNLTAGEMEGVLKAWDNGWDDAYLPRYQWGVMVARPDFIATEPELVRKVIRAAVRSARYAADHLDEWAAFMANQHGFPEDVVRKSLEDNVHLYELNGALDMEGLARAIDLQRRLGAFDAELTAADVVDDRFIPEPAAA